MNENTPLERNLPTPENEPDDKKLHQKMTLYVQDLLIHDFQKLCHLIYRHDVNEKKFLAAVQIPDIDSQASCIADLIIEREKEKMITRQAYQKYKKDQNKDLPE
ncbi:MAG: hypothetical protein IH595_11800 [Bacteroidales bacterium]|nr:hypothetical protein [Bacteroidales bacterium]